MPETADYLARAREYLNKARGLLDVLHYSDEAARAAYLAGFHAAQALIFERTAGPRRATADCAPPLPGWRRTIRALIGRSPDSSHVLIRISVNFWMQRYFAFQIAVR
jgi:hypothetical protein